MSDALKPLIGAAADRPLTRAEAEQARSCLTVPPRPARLAGC